jgi:hypothetical protein
MGAVSSLSSRLIEAYTANKEQGSEQTVTAYIAAMSERNRYAQAIAQVPDSFKNSRNRTYLSAPFFNSLSEMDRSLAARNVNLLSMLIYAVENKSLSVFTVPNMADYLLRETNTRRVREFLAIPAAMNPFAPSVLEAAGILDTHAALLAARHEYAALLQSVLESCLAVIENSCALEGGRLAVLENASPLSPIQSADVGAALINYGTARNQTAVKNTGYLILSSLCADLSVYDLRTLGELYQRAARTNTYFPHSTLLADEGGRKVWAWHVSRSIAHDNDARGNVTITIDFLPSENAHYLIIKGILPFRSIEINDTPYRTDPRFETYNSSGYIYNAETQTLFLKSRYKEPQTTIRLIYYTPPPRQIEPVGSAVSVEAPLERAAELTWEPPIE